MLMVADNSPDILELVCSCSVCFRFQFEGQALPHSLNIYIYHNKYGGVGI
eukprot:NODE_1307_length_1004_cov_8.217801_g909_i0.p7 GENE.NODE_1307_length_1004_cov_8.217801_g909_i0~~NODE_1307_length_1004_cov_8.217801_g909_i0.p7  ORF type:complete len:50 (+),score=0.94 NODE_1307_length_1004_cov_8.217801_g909_i0:57-206(+)